MIGLLLIASCLAFAYRARIAAACALLPAAARMAIDRAWGVRNDVSFDASGNIAEISFWFDGVRTRISVPYATEYLFAAGDGDATAIMPDGSSQPLHFGEGFFCRYAPEDFGARAICLSDPERVIAVGERL